MDNAVYAGLTRQAGLMREMQIIANNLANQSTSGFRREGVIFSEHVRALGPQGSLSQASASARQVDLSPGELTQTGAPHDLAIRGDGFFLIEGPGGQMLTRAGHFAPDAEGMLATPLGYRLLDEAGGPIVVPQGADRVQIARDGMLSVDGNVTARIGTWGPTDPLGLVHRSDTFFTADGYAPVESHEIMQGYLEDANVQPMLELARMIEVQRSYELGQDLIDREDQRIRSVVDVLGR